LTLQDNSTRAAVFLAGGLQRLIVFSPGDEPELARLAGAISSTPDAPRRCRNAKTIPRVLPPSGDGRMVACHNPC